MRIRRDLRALAREFDLGGVILFARNVEAPEQVAELAREAQALAQELPLVGERRPGRRPGRAAEGAVHRVAADGDARAGAATRRWRSGSRARWRRSCKAVGITLDYAPVLDIHTNPKNPVIGDRALAERAEDVARLGRRDHPDAAGRRASPRAASTSPGTATRSPTRTSSCRSSSIRRIACEAVEFVPFRAAIAADVASIMTAHVLVPALDEERPATLSPRDRRRACCATSSGSTGVILSDDLEMKAISRPLRRAARRPSRRSRPAATPC